MKENEELKLEELEQVTGGVARELPLRSKELPPPSFQ